MRDRLGEMLACEDMTRIELARYMRHLRGGLVRENGTVRYGVLSYIAVAWDDMKRRQYEKRANLPLDD